MDANDKGCQVKRGEEVALLSDSICDHTLATCIWAHDMQLQNKLHLQFAVGRTQVFCLVIFSTELHYPVACIALHCNYMK